MKTDKKETVANEFPEGWDEARVRRVLDYYEHQTEEEAAAEHATAFRGQTLMDVPHELVPVVRQIIAEHERARRVDK